MRTNLDILYVAIECSVLTKDPLGYVCDPRYRYPHLLSYDHQGREGTIRTMIA